ncbi:MAG: hypothetical protein IJC87_03005 [Clostridia bacterium]|nr:hypothetical protein [Clostridia bacterium]
MIISFFGHANFSCDEQFFIQTVQTLQEIIGDSEVEFFVGSYGNFDSFGLKCAKEIKLQRADVKITRVTPYLNKEYAKDKLIDGNLYPEIEHVPPKFAIIKRNEWVIDKSDIVIFYMKFSTKKTYDFYLYAKRKNKRIINLADSPKL